MALKKVKLNYFVAVPAMHPVKTVPVSGNHMEKLDASIQQKVKQNQYERNESIIAAEKYFVTENH